jgi:hypothetical protein
MSLFRPAPEDPLKAQMRQLEAKERKLEREMERLQAQIQNPAPPPRETSPVEVLPPEGEADPRNLPRPEPLRRQKLSAERRRARRRVLVILGILAVLALVIFRVAGG